MDRCQIQRLISGDIMYELTPDQRNQIGFLMNECEQRSIEDLDIKGCEECDKLELCKSLFKDLDLKYMIPKAIKRIK